MFLFNLGLTDGSQALTTARAKGPSTTATTGKSLSTLFFRLFLFFMQYYVIFPWKINSYYTVTVNLRIWIANHQSTGMRYRKEPLKNRNKKFITSFSTSMRFVPLSVLLLVTTIIITIVLFTLQYLYNFYRWEQPWICRMLTRGFD